MKNNQQSYWKIFQTPILLAIISIVGLLSALLGDGVWDILSWFSLFMPVLATFAYPIYLNLVKKKRVI
jgi:hypothetical protein